ncbi:hypothetical protein ACRZXV_004931 [Serratia liquefaciens]
MFNVALFGAGRIGQIHAANIVAHPDCRLVRLASLHSGKPVSLEGQS